MKVGLCLPQTASEGGGTWPEIRARAAQAEAGGADSLWVCDHFLNRPATGSETGYHEPWSLLSALAAVTSTVELGPLVLATSFRSPGLTAKMAATLDEVAGGRLILGLGCGWHEAEYRAFGYPFDHRVGRFEEALQVIAPLLRGERVTFEGRWTNVRDAVLVPPPSGRVPILVAAKGDRMLRLTARHADQWQTAWFGQPDDRYRARHERLLEACATEGRDPATLAITVGVDVNERADDGRLVEASLPLDAAAIADGLDAWAVEGAEHVQLGVHPMDDPSFAIALEGMQRFRERQREPARR